MKHLKIALILFTICFNTNVFSQKKEKIKISGFIRDSLNKPIEDCVIFIDNIKQKKKSNKKGFYNLKLKEAPKKLMFYSYRHGITEIDYPNKSNINITFKKMGIKEKTKFKEVSEKENKNRYRYRDIYAYLRGTVAGVKVNPDNTIIIRGITTLYGSNQPLYVLNKMAINKDDIETINPNDIKSVKVLKGSETSIWGVRGAAGVIVITTY